MKEKPQGPRVESEKDVEEATHKKSHTHTETDREGERDGSTKEICYYIVSMCMSVCVYLKVSASFMSSLPLALINNIQKARWYACALCILHSVLCLVFSLPFGFIFLFVVCIHSLSGYKVHVLTPGISYRRIHIGSHRGVLLTAACADAFE